MLDSSFVTIVVPAFVILPLLTTLVRRKKTSSNEDGSTPRKRGLAVPMAVGAKKLLRLDIEQRLDDNRVNPLDSSRQILSSVKWRQRPFAALSSIRVSPHDLSLDSFTMMCWICKDLSGSSVERTILESSKSPTIHFGERDGQYYFQFLGRNDYCSAPIGQGDGQWDHVAFVHEDASFKIFVNGQDNCTTVRGVSTSNSLCGAPTIRGRRRSWEAGEKKKKEKQRRRDRRRSEGDECECDCDTTCFREGFIREASILSEALRLEQIQQIIADSGGLSSRREY